MLGEQFSCRDLGEGAGTAEFANACKSFRRAYVKKVVAADVEIASDSQTRRLISRNYRLDPLTLFFAYLSQ